MAGLWHRLAEWHWQALAACFPSQSPSQAWLLVVAALDSRAGEADDSGGSKRGQTVDSSEGNS